MSKRTFLYVASLVAMFAVGYAVGDYAGDREECETKPAVRTLAYAYALDCGEQPDHEWCVDDGHDEAPAVCDGDEDGLQESEPLIDLDH